MRKYSHQPNPPAGGWVFHLAIKKTKYKQMKWICLFIISSLAFFGAEGQQKNGSIKTVVIDAGHGGKDPGTIVGRAKEKNIVLDIALKLGSLIKQNQKNIKVLYIRDGDYFVPLMDRAQIANRANADLFISIHANYCGSPEIYGLSLIHISEPTRRTPISYAVFCLK